MTGGVIPYSYDPNEDEDQQNAQNAQAPSLASGTQAFGGAANTSGGASAGSSNASAAAPTSSGSFQNLNSYLDANAGSGFGDQFVGKVNNDVNAATTAQTQAASDFKNASDAGAVKQNQATLDSTFSDPYATSQDPSQTAAYQAQLNAQYQGPQSYSDDAAAYQKASGATQKAQDTAQAAQTEGGRFALLNNYFGTPDYSQGQQSLDNLLIQGNQGTQQGLQQAQQNANQAQVNFQAQQAPLQQYAAQNNAMTQATAQNAQTQSAAQVAQMQAANQAALTAAQTNAVPAYNNNLNLLNQLGQPQNEAAQALAQQLGLTKQSVDGFSGYFTGGQMNPNDYYTQGAAPDISSVTTLAQQQKLNALQGLMGSAQDPFTASEAGTYNAANPGTFNSTIFNQQQQANLGQFDKSYQPLLQSLQSDQSAYGATQNNANPGNGLQADPAAAARKVALDQAAINNLLGQYGLNPAYSGSQTGGVVQR